MKNTFFLLAALLAAPAVPAAGQSPYVQRTNLPTLYIETTSGADPEDKENYLPCTVTLVDGAATTTYTLADGGVRGRGNTTWGAKKRPWRLKFDKKTALLGPDYAKAKSWTVLANAFDKSLMRNALTRALGVAMHLEFAPAARFVDLVMNGTYRGTYQLSDQMEARAGRVPVNETTGWLLEYANAEDKVDEPKVRLEWAGTYYGNVEVKNPEFAGDDLAANPALATEITSYLNDTLGSRLDVSVQGYDFVNPRTGYRAIADTASLVNWYVATEITANWDGLYSIYMFREGEAGAPLHFGPLWDEDLAYGNHNETYDYFPSNQFYKQLLAECNFNRWQFPGGYRKMQPVVLHLWDDPWFALAAERRLCALIDGGLQATLEHAIDSMRTELAQSAADNFAVWSISGDDPGFAPRTERRSWAQSVNNLRAFVGTRLAMLRARFAEKNAANRLLDEAQDNRALIAATASAGSGVGVSLRHSATAGAWNAVCLPFALSRQLIDYLYGAGTVVEQLAGTERRGNITVLRFAKTDAMQAGQPYLVRPTRTVDVPYSFLDQTFVAAPQPAAVDGCKLCGTFAPATLTPGASLFAVGADGQPVAAASQPVAAFGAYVAVPSGVVPAIELEGFATGIAAPAVDAAVDAAPVFDLSGRRVAAPARRGVYVQRGRKTVVR